MNIHDKLKDISIIIKDKLEKEEIEKNNFNASVERFHSLLKEVFQQKGFGYDPKGCIVSDIQYTDHSTTGKIYVSIDNIDVLSFVSSAFIGLGFDIGVYFKRGSIGPTTKYGDKEYLIDENGNIVSKIHSLKINKEGFFYYYTTKESDRKQNTDSEETFFEYNHTLNTIKNKDDLEIFISLLLSTYRED